MEAVERIRKWLKKKEYDGVILGRRDNYTWVSGGAKNHVLTSTEVGIAWYIIGRDSIDVVADTSDFPRIREEQNPLGGRVHLVPWYESVEEYLAGMIRGKKYVSDTGIAGTKNVQEELQGLRMKLTDRELDRYREIGVLCAQIVEDVCKKARPGNTEEEVAGRLRCKCIINGISPDCVLVGADERILNYRHPAPTDKKVKKSLMVVLGGEKYGLNVSMTRMVYFGEVPGEIRLRYEKTGYIFACMQRMMKDGMTFAEYFGKVQKLYDEAGYGEEWKMHHQGGPTGYACREFVILPGMKGTLREGWAYAWNPTIRGTKCEETTYLSKEGVLTFTRTKEWPRKTIETPYGAFETADILEM